MKNYLLLLFKTTEYRVQLDVSAVKLELLLVNWLNVLDQIKYAAIMSAFWSKQKVNPVVNNVHKWP